MGSVTYDRVLEHVRIYAQLISHCLKCLDFGAHNKFYGESPMEKFEIMWMKTPQQTNKYMFRICFTMHLMFIIFCPCVNDSSISFSCVFCSVDCGIFALKFIDMRLKKEDVFNFNQSQSLTFRRELAANLWAHGKWKKDSGVTTRPVVLSFCISLTSSRA